MEKEIKREMTVLGIFVIVLIVIIGLLVSGMGRDKDIIESLKKKLTLEAANSRNLEQSLEEYKYNFGMCIFLYKQCSGSTQK